MTDLNEQNRAINMRTVYLNASYFPAVEMLAAVGTAVILLYGGSQAIEGAIQVGVVVSFVAYLATFLEPIQELSQLYTTYQQGMAALDKIFDLLDTEPDMVDAPGAIDPGTLRGEIAMEGVWFSYKDDAKLKGAEHPPDDSWALRDVDLHVPPGQTLALVGATGAGKSTFAKLSASTIRRRAGCWSTATTCAASSSWHCGASSGSSPRRGSSSPAACGRMSPSGAPRRASGDRGGDPHGGGERVRRRPARRHRDPQVGERGVRALGRPAAADRLRPCPARRAADPDPRRGHLKRRRADREDDRARARSGCWPGARQSSLPTASRPSAAPARSSSSKGARSPSRAPTTS